MILFACALFAAGIAFMLGLHYGQAIHRDRMVQLLCKMDHLDRTTVLHHLNRAAEAIERDS